MTTHRIDSKNLPVPRLELRWEINEGDNKDKYSLVCNYNLVIPLGVLDIRNENGSNQLVTKIGYTYTTGHYEDIVHKDFIETPFRDGSHIGWDAAELRLPAFVVCGDVAEFINPKFQVLS